MSVRESAKCLYLCWNKTSRIRCWKMKYILAIILLFTLACESEEEKCTNSVDCEDDLEMICDEPIASTSESGDKVTVTACTYINYKHCFEKTICERK